LVFMEMGVQEPRERDYGGCGAGWGKRG